MQTIGLGAKRFDTFLKTLANLVTCSFLYKETIHSKAHIHWCGLSIQQVLVSGHQSTWRRIWLAVKRDSGIKKKSVTP